MSLQLTQLQAAVDAQTALVTQTIGLLQVLDPAHDQAAIDNIASQIENNNAALQQAVEQHGG